MTPYTIKDYLAYATKQLQDIYKDMAAFEARILLEFVTCLTTDRLLLDSQKSLTDSQIELYMQAIARRKNLEPIAYITGRREFYGLDFIVSPQVLIPRPDSEVLVTKAIAYSQKRNFKSILELGVGSGCLLLSILHNLKSDVIGAAVDISPEAIAIARKNYLKLGLKNQVKFLEQDWADGLVGQYDLIISNPPYIVSKEIEELQIDVKDFEPRRALDGGADGLGCYRDIAKLLPKLLLPNGLVLLEIGIHQERLVAEIIAGHGFKVIEEVRDLAGVIRCLVCSLFFK